MKKFLFTILTVLCVFSKMLAGDREHFTFNAGAAFPSTLNATVGYELQNHNGHAYEIFGEIGDHWGYPICHNFWKGYFWDGGFQYKHQLKRLKNGTFRIFGGAQFGAVQTKFFLGIRAGFEYCYIFKNNWEFCITQFNCVNFIHGDTFRNGLMIGFKIPL